MIVALFAKRHLYSEPVAYHHLFKYSGDKLLVEEKNLSIEEAFAVLYYSRAYAKLSDPNPQLHYQSAGYVFSLLKEELMHV